MSPRVCPVCGDGECGTKSDQCGKCEVIEQFDVRVCAWCGARGTHLYVCDLCDAQCCRECLPEHRIECEQEAGNEERDE